jgi:hypothetical protein
VRIDQAEVEHYGVYLKDKSRPPSQGGNSGAWHQHVVTINGKRYSFLAPWSGKFVYKREKVSFDWDWDPNRSYRNIDASSVVALTESGEEVRRGQRNSKKWRTANTRPPGRRSDWED